MKSLALHLIAFLLLGLLHIAASSHFLLLLVSTVSATIHTTTSPPPSLLAPTMLPLAPSTITTSVPAATLRRQRHPAARRLLAHANSMDDSPVESTTFASTRLVRNASAIISSGVRQNRSLQSAAMSANRRNGNGGESSENDAVDRLKSKRLDSRHRFRTSQLSSNSGDETESSASTERQTSHQRPSKQTHLPPDEGASTEHAPQAKNSTKLRQTLKTPRMIQRLVAGHIQNAEGRSTYQVSAVTANSTVFNSTTTLKPAFLYFRRKQPMLSSSYRRHESKITTSISTPIVVATTTAKPTITRYDYDDDDEALLDDPGDFDNWDNGILRLSAGSGKESAAKSKKNKEDSKKTLSDQVRDGKYGLIEKELFRREPKRPGILSYLPNKEVPVDNEQNFGGLNEEDIWLAEDHLLVIKGGGLNEGELNEPWPPIDDYDAPGRQIKIPPNPKVPPPFPVQLEENGPVQFIGNNKFTVVYPVANESIPVYPAGAETNDTPTENEGDNEKNSITRPGSSQDSTEDGPGYIYPAPYPPWIYHNQTFVNPFLTNARPISFPGLGPFPFGRNGSLENSNGTDYFDEDDPSLYYPPAYSFVYKNNYSSPVSAGPLVPGIVLPPPANQFSRLEKPDVTYSTTLSPLPRQRVYPVVSSTSKPSTTTTTTTIAIPTTTNIPYRQTITKVSEYIPKTITITTAPPAISTSIPSTPIIKLRPSLPTTPSAPPLIEPVPVPVAVPVPVYPDSYPSTKSNSVTFIPTTPQPTTDTLSKSHPIYYEYFEAKRQPTTPNYIDDFLSTTVKPLAPSKPIKIYATSKRPFKNQAHRNYLQPVPPHRQFVPENVVYITPKPDVRYKIPPQTPIFKPRPLDFEREVAAIRETLRYYQNQQLRDNSIPRTPKAKAIYEYSFDATKNLQPVQPIAGTGSFQPPTEFDDAPFKPMVTYSPPVDDENGFKAIPFDQVDNEQPATQQQQQQQQENQQQQQQLQPKYQSSTTLVPVQPEAQYQTAQGAPKKLRLGAKYLQQPLYQQPQEVVDYQTTSAPVYGTQSPWVSFQKPELNDYEPRMQPEEPYSEQLQLPPPTAAPRNRGFTGYYYGPPPPVRQNNRFYNEPFHNPMRKIVHYPLQHNRPQQQQQQQQQAPPTLWSLANDTYVNYAPNRPPLNPDAEFIDPYQTIPVNPYGSQGQRYPPPALSHQSQYYAPSQRLPHPLRQQQPTPLHRDILVNYRQPLPPVNPDSEYISHPQALRSQANQIYRSNAYRTLNDGGGGGGDQANVYYITPKYRRANNSQNNNNNNNSNNGNSNMENNGSENVNTNENVGSDNGKR